MRALPLTIFAALLLWAAPAQAAYTTAVPAAGGSTIANEVKTDWTGACDLARCSLFEVVYSQSTAVDATGRLVEQPGTDPNTDIYETSYVGDPAPMTTLSPRLNPGLWYVQLQWRQCDADYNCTDVQSPLTSFRLLHSVVGAATRVTYRYQYIRKIDFDVRFASGNAPLYRARGIVSVQKRRANGTLYWAPIWSQTKTMYGQIGATKAYFTWSAGRTRRGTKLRIQGVITAPGMRPIVRTAYTTSV